MACNACPKKPVVPPTETPVFYKAAATAVRGKDGRPYPINQPLISAAAFRRSLPVVIVMKGFDHTVEAAKPALVVQEILRLLKLNRIEANAADIWLNCNIQWLQKTPSRWHVVELSELLKIANPVEREAEGTIVTAPSVPLAEWAPKALQTLQLDLMVDDYSWPHFLELVELVLRWGNPLMNSSITDSRFFHAFNRHANKLAESPIYDLEEARKWADETIASTLAELKLS